MNNSYVLTETGRKKCEIYISELKAKRKEILDAGIDTANYTALNFIPEELLEDLLSCPIDENLEIRSEYSVTDHYDADYPICLKYGVDFLKKESDRNLYWMEWYNDICNQDSFDKYVYELCTSMDTGANYNYKQAARLFYTNSAEFVMVELQVPTEEMLKEEPDLMPWLDAYLVKRLDDYDASDEIATTIRCKRVLSFANAEAEMLKFARKQLWDSMKTARSTNELLDHLTKLIEANDERFSFECGAGGENATMEIFDKEKGIGYAVNIKPIEYSEYEKETQGDE